MTLGGWSFSTGESCAVLIQNFMRTLKKFTLICECRFLLIIVAQSYQSILPKPIGPIILFTILRLLRSVGRTFAAIIAK
jgi:hypothetical protein